MWCSDIWYCLKSLISTVLWTKRPIRRKSDLSFRTLVVYRVSLPMLKIYLGVSQSGFVLALSHAVPR